MENLIISMNVVLPILILVGFGYYLKKVNLLNDNLLNGLNNLLFKIFLPTLLFTSMYKTDLKTAFNGGLLAFSGIGLLILFGILLIIIPKIEKENRKRGVMIQGIFRSNFLILALPIASALYDDSELGPVTLAVAFVIPIYNVLSVVVLEYFRGGKPDVKKMLKGIVTNPLMIASMIGIIFLVSEMKLPFVFEKSVNDVSKIGTPLGIILLGAGFKIEKIGEHLYSTIISVLGKLVFAPVLALALAIFMGFRDIELITIFLIFGAPTAISSFNMAQQMDGDSDLAGQIVVFSSVFCSITIFIGIFILKEMALI